MESRIKDAISKSEVLMLEKISSRIASAISTYLEFERHREFRKTLTEFVPDSIVEKLNGERGKVQETGYLLMVDLKDSSKIAQSISAEGWGEFVRDRVVPLIMPIAKQQGFQLHQVIWDAFYFTIPSMEQNENAINKLVLMHSAVRAEINKLYQVEFANIQNYELDPDVDKLRSCFVFGDTSRGFSESPTPVWTIVGFSMSHVSKLEAECKNFSGSLFTTNDFVKKYEILSTDCGLLPLTGETIAGIEQNKVFDLVV